MQNDKNFKIKKPCFRQHDILAETRSRITTAITFSRQNDAGSPARSSYLGKSCPRCHPRFNVWASVISNCILVLSWGCYHFFHWPYENSFPRQSHDTIRDNTSPVSSTTSKLPIFLVLPFSRLLKNLHSQSSNSPLKKREGNCAELAFAKTSGSATGEREKKLANS